MELSGAMDLLVGPNQDLLQPVVDFIFGPEEAL
jgi:hypothetical protein